MCFLTIFLQQHQQPYTPYTYHWEENTFDLEPSGSRGSLGRPRPADSYRGSDGDRNRPSFEQVGRGLETTGLLVFSLATEAT